MQTVFSHIIQKRFSRENEDVATDALAFVLHSSESVRNGMMRLIRSVAPSMPSLHFRTQQTEGNIRPDMWGYDDAEARVFIENKFWAGLTDNQPVSYLMQLAEYTQPTVLFVVVPDAREQTMLHELNRRLKDKGISTTDTELMSDNLVHSSATDIGPILALTSWTRLLSSLELEVADDPSARSDLLQLRALCEAADNDAFVPITADEVTDQRIPALIFQLNTVVQASVDLAVTEGVLNLNGLRPQASWERFGRYARIKSENGEHQVGVWIGIHFGYWKKHGITPFWLLFSGDWGRFLEVRSFLEPWDIKEGVFTTLENGEFAVAIDIAIGEDKDQVVRRVVDRFKGIAEVLSPLNKKTVQLKPE